MTRSVRQLRRRWMPLVLCVVMVASLLAVGATPTAAQAPYAPIGGEGSSAAANAIVAMRVALIPSGITVDYTPSGSTAGRRNFLNGSADFAVSDLPFQFAPEDGSAPESPAPGTYGYVPIAAGGTSLVYNLVVGGERVTNLRLSGENVAKIFTRVITRWNDPALVVDNPQIALPDRAIVPVVNSFGSGTTNLLTTWMIERHPSTWNGHCVASGRAPACGPTSFYPTVSGIVAQAGDLGVAGYVSQGFADGSIGYVSSSAAVGSQLPVAKVLNAAGYYTAPTPDNVAVSLLEAVVITNAANPATYLTADLTGVFNGTDPRNYELSSYSYLIVPTVERATFGTAEGRTLAAFGYHSLCEAQQQSAALGYSPLPIDLVRAGLDQLALIPGADVQNLDIASCANPTFSPMGEDLLLANAALPEACDIPGALQCGAGAGSTSQCPAPAVSALDVFAGDVVIVNWVPPTPCAAVPSSYDVEILSGSAVIAAQTGLTGATASFVGLEPGSYSASVTPTFAVDTGLTGTAGSDSVSVAELALGAGRITVTRPPGALVLTQRCGVYNALPRYDAVDAFPGFPFDLPAAAASADRVGTAPLGDPVDDPDLGIVPDPEFANYPLPDFPTYPTECGVSMGTGELITSGSLAGQFFAAHGRINEVTVVDIRDNDSGWTIRGDISDRFNGSSGDSFSGDYLGWQPVVTFDSGPIGGEGPGGSGPLYDQTVVAGPPIRSGTGFSTPAAGLTDNAMLARASAGSGLGIAALDARLTLLIPASIDAGDYAATLTITAG